MPKKADTIPTYKIRGIVQAEPRRVSDALAPTFSLFPGAARDGTGEVCEIPADNVVRVELDNGFVLWSRVDDLVRDFGALPTRDGNGAWEFSRLVPKRSSTSERGIAGLAVKVLDFFGIDLAEKSAVKLGTLLEKKQLGHEPGLYRLDLLATRFSLSPLGEKTAIPAADGPILVFLHGTASSTEGSFGELWKGSEGEKLRQKLAPIYGNRSFALEHRTLTESPVANALALAERLPKGAEVHLVSHSRGGMVGELLCLAGCTDLDQVLTGERIDNLFKADRTMAGQLGLLPLSDKDMQVRDAAYDADRKRLARLVEVLAGNKLRITRFARVACPARGTTLASGRLDRWLSVLDYVAKAATNNGLFADGMQFLHAVVKERTDPRILPGIEAMVPGSALTRLLNATSDPDEQADLTTSADLTVIAGDIEPGDGIWNSLKVLASDWFYQNDHDLVVDSRSMTGGLPRRGGARYRQDKGPRVNHFRYFINSRSLGWLESALTRGDGDQAGFLPIGAERPAAPSVREIVRRSRSRSETQPTPIAVVLPGTMGSELTASEKAVWLNYWSLLRGGLKKLARDKKDIEPVGLVDDFYGPLVEFLARSHQVEVFPYDWRFSVREAAKKLVVRLAPLVTQAERTKKPLRLVAHSMGGLVVRSMIADGGEGTALWKRIKQLPDSRFLMLGTPNLGSYEAVRWLTGFNPTQAKLSLLDITQSTDEIIGLVSRFPGLLELLPFAPDDPDFTDQKRWSDLKKALSARWQTAESSDLKTAGATWKFLKESAPPDPEHMCYVAGSQPATVIDYQVVPGDAWLRPDIQKIEFIASPEGDGTVAWDSGRLPGVPMWYVANTAHDMLCAQPAAFPGYLDILVSGRTTRLPTTPPARSRGEARANTFVLPAAPPADGIPGEQDLRSMGFSGQPEISAKIENAAPRIKVRISHGSLSYACHPVLVGHYQGDTVVNAEALIDRQLAGQLTRSFDLGLYPGRIGSHALFLNDSPSAKPAGAIVVGLGQIGELRPALLEASARTAFLDFALRVAQWPDARFGEAGRPRSAAVSCLLVGTGDGGVRVGDSIKALLAAAVDANAALVAKEMNDRVIIDRLEFVELYEDVAIAATDALREALQEERLRHAVDWEKGCIESGQAGHRRVRFDPADAWYQRVQIKGEQDSDRNDVLRFVFPTDRARAEETTATGQLALADEFIRIASSNTRQNAEAAKTLFEMLLPLRLRDMAPQQGNMVVQVDSQSACYPWELLENRWGADDKPPVVKAGFIRQFKTAEFRPQPLQLGQNTALVIGDPDLGATADFDQLPGARAEAEAVSSLLAGHAFEVTDCIGQSPLPILENLHKNSWRILHLAGHGVHEYRAGKDKPASGMVIGHEQPPGSGIVLLTPGDIQQMRFVPDLVFINCCHLGQMRNSRPLNRLGLAANLGEEFIRMGVRAVIAAGWAVDDQAGAAFASRFYTAMLDGKPFGEAVRLARADIYQRFESCNTWGAYQCYGDPDFRFFRQDQPDAVTPQPFASPRELITRLENLAADLRAGWSGSVAGKIEALLARIPEGRKDDWLQQADLSAALGLAWGEARVWDKAIRHLKTALTAEKSEFPLRVLEQYANFRVRHVADSWKSAPTELARRNQKRSELLALINAAIFDLDTLCRCALTAERYSLLGSAYKRMAVIEEDVAHRTEALVNMANHYRLAYRHKPEAYPYSNWVAGHLLARQIDPVAAAIDEAPQEKDLEKLIAGLTASRDREPSFWDSASLADLQLTRLLWQGNSRGRRRNAITGDQVIEAYREAIARGASPREKSSVAEHIQFLVDLWPQEDKDIHAALKEILESLS